MVFIAVAEAGKSKPVITEHVASVLLSREERIIHEARRDRDVFKSFVMEDEHGDRLIPGKIHLSWSAHVEHCIKVKKYCGIIAPWGHGKTEQTIIGDALFDLGRNPQMRQKIISNNDANAANRIQSVKTYIEQNERFKMVFPNIEPDYKRGWSTHRLFVKRKGASKDPSIESLGVLSSGIGGRADKLMFDDVCDHKNSIQEPKKRDMVSGAVRETWLSRLDVTNRQLNYVQVLYIATPWHEDDCTMSYVMKNPEFLVLVQPIAEKLDKIVCLCDGEKWLLPLWDTKWNQAELQKRRRTVGERAWARGGFLKPYSDDDIVLKSFDKCVDYTITPFEAMKMHGKNWRVVSAVDPSGSGRPGFAIFTLACERTTGIRIPLDIRRGAWKGREPIEQCLAVQSEFNPDVFVIENNAVQERVVSWVQDAGEGKINTKPFQTGRNKADPTAGVEGMDIEFSNGLWVIALGHVDHRDNPDCECPWCVWQREVKFFPTYGTSDTLMAMWFAREEVRGGRSLDSLIKMVAGSGNRSGAGKGGPAVEEAFKPKTISVQEMLRGSETSNW